MASRTGDAAFGFRPIRYLNGSPYNGAVQNYVANAGTAIGIGDPVILNASGQAALATISSDILLGYCMGAVNSASASQINGLSSASGGQLRVAIADNLIVLAQEEGSANMTALDVGTNWDFVSAAHANVGNSKLSRYVVGNKAAAAGMFRLVALHDSPDNDVTGLFRLGEFVAVETHYGERGSAGI